MILWFKCWKQDQGWWVPILTCSFQVGAAITINIETRVLSVIAQVNMSQGESQVLWVLIKLQYLAEVDPKSPPPGHVVHSVLLILRPLKQLEISFQPHAVLGYGTSVDRALQSKQMCYVQTFHCCPAVYVLQEICHDQMINQRIMSQPWEG